MLVALAPKPDSNSGPTRIGDMKGSPILESIQWAFANTEYPGDRAIPFGSDCVDEEPERFHYLRGRSWQDVELDEVPGLSAVLMWLSAEGLRYYLPAFLAAAVTAPAVPGCSVPRASRPQRLTRTLLLEFVDGMTAEQKDVVRLCLLNLRVNLEGVFSYWDREGLLRYDRRHSGDGAE
jgi:hypothetical protein